MSDETDLPARPDGACLLHRPPTSGERPWVRADPGYATCSGCLDSLRERLAEVGERYARLDPAPGESGPSGGSAGRGSPGFSPSSPANEHVIAMTDPRSSSTARAWKAADGRVHCESERPPLSVRSELDTLAWTIAEARGIGGPPDEARVPALLSWIDRQLDWVTRGPLCVEVARAVRTLLVQLKPVTGDPRPHYVGPCPNEIPAPEGHEPTEGEQVLCGARLYAPTRGDTIRCRNEACRRAYPRSEWLHLGRVIQAAELQVAMQRRSA